jgi:hypothetical protein
VTRVETLGLIYAAFALGLVLGFGMGWIEGGLFVLRGIFKVRKR